MKLTTSFCLIYTIANVVAALNRRPCMPTNNSRGHEIFKTRHILNDEFNTNSRDAWLTYLISKNLCGRVPRQSFMQAKYIGAVQNICRGDGINLQQNLCISRQSFKVFHIKTEKPPNKRCRIKAIQVRNHPVVVGCNAINNRCLPVHYARYRGQKPGRNARICQ